MYDIDAALAELDQIMWRTPQYAASIAPGDVVAIWRSGNDAGIVGVGRVAEYPGERTEPVEDAKFALSLNESERTTRVPLAVQPCDFVAKAVVAELAGWSAHQIITAPMGTVFQVSQAQWASLSSLLPDVPSVETVAIGVPPAFGWEERRKDVYPLPGGYGRYLDSLAAICTQVAASQPDHGDLTAWLQHELGISETSSRLTIGFLLRIGLLHERSGTLDLSELARTWLDTRRPELVIGLLHSRARFVGEFLYEATEPITDTEILAIANGYYDASWKTRAQIRRRRGWLESAGYLNETSDGLLQTTQAGKDFLTQIELRGRSQTTVPTPAEPTPTIAEPTPSTLPDPKGPATILQSPVSSIIERLHETGNDGKQADEFERETAEAFDRLGFRSTWLGKAGRTDVLLEADLGHGFAYRVIVDCKSTGRGSVSAQIDWDTIDEHRKQHNADYAIIVAPAFGGGKLGDRASRHDTVLLTIDDLSELLIQHERVPLTLETYRTLFTAETIEESLAAIGEIALDAERRLELVDAILQLLEAHGPRMAPMSARDFDLLLLTREDLPDATEAEIAEVLQALAAPLLGLLEQNDAGAVRFVAQPETAAAALRILAERITHTSPPEPNVTA